MTQLEFAASGATTCNDRQYRIDRQRFFRIIGTQRKLDLVIAGSFVASFDPSMFLKHSGCEHLKRAARRIDAYIA
jgi:hypothetical protein